MTVSETCGAPGDCRALAELFRALSHPARIEILRTLAGCEAACCGEIVECLPLAQSTVSQHLSVLREAGLVERRDDGRCCHYSLRAEVIERFSREVGDLFALLRAATTDAPRASGD
ncbi:ArsR/SmtB family transcription factor [Stappia indica]|uniref:ArsR/SmtB family transcription factor n=1 Tax=Stappia indica TaxID=538381 RepID=UPI001CD7ED42|nr:metalloregulator ArsR/SmtB family transcription factor [Stappia indica]MCA1298703.1 metalloregulator ArsR/SmtB family transcription factor [Stappia indica]